ncbi:hypothetical protein [Corynebacterium sp. MSK008]|uniref:hypothetical protein n=1 Tax=Corynebacterium sp. MSK008 TaxID=3050188 RepID=UPI00254B3E2C|nr:hypothetical protein [Corynebacterium sp. MSK008]MDK8879939.1 hypothetical protein [Corynebacterium sp. MSK008]
MVEVSIERGTRGLTALLSRALALDAQASARIQEVGEGQLDVFVTTPFDAIASRRTSGSTTHPGATVSARAMLDALQSDAAEVGPARDAAWPGALPPASGFIAREEVPIGVARRLADEGRNLARQFSGPAGPPRSLLDGTVLTADADSNNPVEIPMRMIFACTALGLIPGFEAPAEIPRHLRVATSGSWVRLDAPFGSVYRSTRPNLLF